MVNTTKTKQVFLGGTCGSNTWRETIVIPGLLERGVSVGQMFNPVVSDWNEQAQAREDEAKRTMEYMLYVIASPEPGTTDVSAYSLVELLMALYDAPERTVALFDTSGMQNHTAKAIRKSLQDLRARFPEAPIFTEYNALMDWLASQLSA